MGKGSVVIVTGGGILLLDCGLWYKYINDYVLPVIFKIIGGASALGFGAFNILFRSVENPREVKSSRRLLTFGAAMSESFG